MKSEIFTPSIIAALTSLIISVITLFQFFRSQSNLQKQFDRNLNRNLTSKLYAEFNLQMQQNSD